MIHIFYIYSQLQIMIFIIFINYYLYNLSRYIIEEYVNIYFILSITTTTINLLMKIVKMN